MLQLSNAELINCFNRLMKQETTLTLNILEYIAEIEVRKLYLKEGYPSMYEWLQTKFNYSRAAAWRRIASARALREYPLLKELFLSRELNITTISTIYKHLSAETQCAAQPETAERTPVLKRSRYISRKVREEVRARDGYCCTYVGSDGRRCGSRWDLEIDHIVPYCLGGENEPGNLRLMCRAHNSYRAWQWFGDDALPGKFWSGTGQKKQKYQTESQSEL